MKLLTISFLLILTISAVAQQDEARIRQILDEQTAAWNRGDLENFMKGYWENDSLMFIGKSGVTYGWKNTLENYRRGYPDTASMGKLHFTLIQVKQLNREHFFVVGKWHLKRTIGDLQGHYTLIFRKVNGEWVIVADHSS